MGYVDLQPSLLIGLRGLAKLAKGGFNYTFLIIPHHHARRLPMVTRIPHSVTVPKYSAVASEVATMDLLCSAGLPIPEVYGYSPESGNAAGTKYIFMEFFRGTK